MQPGRFSASLFDEIRGDRSPGGKVPFVWVQEGWAQSSPLIISGPQNSVEASRRFLVFIFSLREAQKWIHRNYNISEAAVKENSQSPKQNNNNSEPRPGTCSRIQWKAKCDSEPETLWYRMMILDRATWTVSSPFGWKDQRGKSWMDWA